MPYRGGFVSRPAHDTRVVVRPDHHDARCTCGWTSPEPTAVDAARACWRHVKGYARRLDVEAT